MDKVIFMHFAFLTSFAIYSINWQDQKWSLKPAFKTFNKEIQITGIQPAENKSRCQFEEMGL